MTHLRSTRLITVRPIMKHMSGIKHKTAGSPFVDKERWRVDLMVIGMAKGG